MNPPPRTGISRASGSLDVADRAGPGAVLLLLRGPGRGRGGAGLRLLQLREGLPDPDVVVVGGRGRPPARRPAPRGGRVPLVDPGLLRRPGPPPPLPRQRPPPS